MKIVQEKGTDKFLVPSSDGKDLYHVDPEQPFCTCRDFIITRMKENKTCKHIEKVRDLVQK